MRTRKTILLVSLLVITSVFLTACGCLGGLLEEREPMDINVFRSVMESEGYTIVDMMYESDEVSEDIFSYYLSVLAENYLLEFSVYTSEQHAIRIFNYLRAQAEASRGVVRTNSWVTGINHASFSQTSDRYFWHIYRVDNTLLFVHANSDYRNRVRELIEKIQ